MPVLSNPRHERFAQELAKGKSANEAYVLAGYEENRGNATRLNANESIQSRVAEIQSRGAQRAEVTVERVVSELAKIGFSDIRRVVQWSGSEVADEVDGEDDGVPRVVVRAANIVRLIGSDVVDDDTAASISEISQTKEGSLRVKMHSKLDALDKIAKYLGLYAPEKHEHTGKDGGPIELTDMEKARRMAFLLTKASKSVAG
jgi:phage terminase small subunit